MTVIAGPVVGLLKKDAEPNKKHILWAHEVNPSEPNKIILKRYDYVKAEWVNLDSNNLFGGVLAVNLAAPPASPSEGDAYVIGAGTGTWLGHDNEHAVYLAGQWNYTQPNNGSVVIKSVGGTVELYIFKDDPAPGSWIIYQTASLTGTENFMVSFDNTGAIISSDHLKKEGDNTIVKGILKFLNGGWISTLANGFLLSAAGTSTGSGWLLQNILTGAIGVDEYYFGIYDNLTDKLWKWGKDSGFEFIFTGVDSLTADRIVTWQDKAITVAGLSDIPPKATQLEVDTGTDDVKYVTSKTLHNKPLVASDATKVPLSGTIKQVTVEKTPINYVKSGILVGGEYVQLAINASSDISFVEIGDNVELSGQVIHPELIGTWSVLQDSAVAGFGWIVIDITGAGYTNATSVSGDGSLILTTVEALPVTGTVENVQKAASLPNYNELSLVDEKTIKEDILPTILAGVTASGAEAISISVVPPIGLTVLHTLTVPSDGKYFIKYGCDVDHLDDTYVFFDVVKTINGIPQGSFIDSMTYGAPQIGGGAGEQQVRPVFKEGLTVAGFVAGDTFQVRANVTNGTPTLRRIVAKLIKVN